MSDTNVTIGMTLELVGILLVLFPVLIIFLNFRSQIVNQSIQVYNLKSIETRKRTPINPGENFNRIWYDCPQVGKNIPKKKKGKKGARVKGFMEDKDHKIIIMDNIPDTEADDLSD